MEPFTDGIPMEGQLEPGAAAAVPFPSSPPLTGIGASGPRYVYALCEIDWRFPTLDVERQFHLERSQRSSSGLTEAQSLLDVLSDDANRYLARELCWVARIRGLDTFVLQPAAADVVDLLVAAIRPAS